MKPNLKEIIHSAIITALTIAAALIWKDVIVAGIELFVPPSEEFLYKLLGAVVATVIVIAAIVLFVKTESEAEDAYDEVEKFTQRFKRKPKQQPNQQPPANIPPPEKP